MANNGIRKYCLGSTRIGRGLLDGFLLEPGGVLRSSDEEVSTRSAILPALDSAQPGCQWGRISLTGTVGAECIFKVRVFASDQNQVIRGPGPVSIDRFLMDPEIPRSEKERLFLLAQGLEHQGSYDVLLNGQEGRYLWIWLEVEGRGSSRLENMRVYVPGDNFFGTLPQVYQEDNDFLKRYLSVFSTMYSDFQEEIDGIPELLDADTAPEQMLPVFASWLGLETDESLFTSEELRKLIKAAPALLARKGSRWAVESVVKLFIEEPVYLVERNLLQPEQREDEEIYGTSPFDFTVMVGRKVDEKVRRRLQFLIDQFRPIRSRYRIVFLSDCGGLDAFTYMDVNGEVLQSNPGSLDDGHALTGMTYLE